MRRWPDSLLLLPVLTLAASLSTAYFCYFTYPHSADESNYLYEADTFARGRVVNPPVPSAHLFAHGNQVMAADRTYSKYPPGWPVVLLVGRVLGAPWVVNPILGAAMVLFTLWFARARADSNVALLGFAAIGLTSWVLLETATYYSHTLTALLFLGFIASMWTWTQRGDIRHIVMGAAALGAMLLTRPFDAVLTGLAGLSFLFNPLPGWKKAKGIAAAAAVGMVSLLLFGLYNHATTGSWLVTGHAVDSAADRPALHHFQLVTLIRRMREHDALGFPLLAVVALAWPARRQLDRTLWRALVISFLVGWLGYATYPWDYPPRVGPRYMFYLIPAEIMLVGAGLAKLLGPRWVKPAALALGLVYGARAVPAALEMRELLFGGSAVDRVTRGLPGPAHIVVLSRSTTTLFGDLMRNSPDFGQGISHGASGSQNVAALRSKPAWVWDGLGPSTLWSLRGIDGPQQIVALGRKGEYAPAPPAEGWFYTWGSSACLKQPRIASMWLNRYSWNDVQHPQNRRFGPCPGEGGFGFSREVAVPSAVSDRRDVHVIFRSFLVLDGPTPVRVTITPDGPAEALVRIGGFDVMTADSRAAQRSLILPRGIYPVSVSYHARDLPRPLNFSVDAPGARLRPRLEPGEEIDTDAVWYATDRALADPAQPYRPSVPYSN